MPKASLRRFSRKLSAAAAVCQHGSVESQGSTACVDKPPGVRVLVGSFWAGGSHPLPHTFAYTWPQGLRLLGRAKPRSKSHSCWLWIPVGSRVPP